MVEARFWKLDIKKVAALGELSGLFIFKVNSIIIIGYPLIIYRFLDCI